MARFSNAVGYILELRDQENLSWFSYICDNAISSNLIVMNPTQVEDLYNILNGSVNYIRANITQPTIQQTAQATTQAQTHNYLETLSNFQNFKNLSSSINLCLDKRISIIFGMNGSGKTSICEALKILAKSEIPTNPINNVRHTDNQPLTSFEYKFTTDTNNITWNHTIGFGLLSNRIKYFDSSVSLRLLTESADTEKIVEFSPFRLELFNNIGEIVNQLRAYIDGKISDLKAQLTTQIESIKNIFADYSDYHSSLSELSMQNYEDLQRTFDNHSALNSTEISLVQELSNQLARMREASSESGLRLQKGEFDSLSKFARKIKKIIRLISNNHLREYYDTYQTLEELKAHKKHLANEIIPPATNVDAFIKFIESSKLIFNYEECNKESICPLCNQLLSENSLDLFKKYHQFLIDDVGNKITENESKLSNFNEFIEGIRNISFESNDYSNFENLKTHIDLLIEWVKKIKEILTKEIKDLVDDDFGYYENTESIQSSLNHLAREIFQRYRTISIATRDSNDLVNQINQKSNQLNELNFRTLFDNHLTAIRNLLSSLNDLSGLESNKSNANFTVLLRKITNKGKEANRELVVGEFTRILNQEYQALSGNTLDDFGVKLSETASEQSVIVDTKIGNEPLTHILSEGEQKIHTLSLFFSELAISNHSIIIFDDPVNSFDYNYSNKFTERLRDCIIANPEKQFIILTHNWDFFVYIQLVLNRANLNNEISVQVIEQCAIVKEYTEDVNRLKSTLTAKLSETSSLSLEDKELISGKLRRLIESVINKCVFNNQRHQFKQKSLSISTFDQFTKLVALTSAEATQLRDLYSNLSVQEHDDPRNHYRNLNRATFQRWYNEIETIETTLINRRPT